MKVMKNLYKKAIIGLASAMVFGLGLTPDCHSMDASLEDYRTDAGFSSEINFCSKFSNYITGTARIANLGHSYKAETASDINDWTADNYTIKSPISLENFYVELNKENFAGGAGFRTFPDDEGLVSALQKIEYQFFPVDATSPLRMRRIGVPALWGNYYFSPDTYVKLLGYETLWSKISPDAVPDLKHKKLDNPTGNQGYSFFSSFGTTLANTAVEVGFFKGWGSWPSHEVEPTSEFSPNPYRLSAAFVKARKHYGTWALSSTALVKHANENAGSVYNMVFSVDKKLLLGRKPVSIGASYFYVQSFEHSRHLRTSPWEDLGNSFAFRASIDNADQQVRYGFEGVVNHEEHGFYFAGITEKWIHESVKLKTQVDFFYDGQKYISDEYDSIKVAGFITYTF
jgi:hypothetical protein